MTTNMLRSIHALLVVSALLLHPPAAGAKAPSAKPSEPSVSLKLDESVKITNGSSLKVEQMENGGIKISGTNAAELDGDPGFDFTKTFSEPVPASAIRFEISGVERPMLVKVTNVEGKTAHTHFVVGREDMLELGTIHYGGSPESDTFSGKLGKLSMFIPIPTMSGDYSIEISRIEIVP